MKKACALAILVVYLSSCMQTSYHSYGASKGKPEVFGRRVDFLISSDFYRDPPDCVLVMRAVGTAKNNHRRMIEQSAARHLRGKLKRVIGPDERDVLLRRLALDLNHDGDRKRFARMQSCRHFAKLEIQKIEENYALIWAQRRVGLAMAIYGESRDSPLWKASHNAGRGDGGLPISPLSLGVAAFSAGRLQGDRDMMPSIIEDVFRRMLVSLPDTRHY